MFGRRLYLPDIHSRNQQLRQYAERSAINAPMQGTAADIIKRAMIAVHAWLRAATAAARLIMQVHDELVLEVATDAVAEVEAGLRQRMAAAAQLRVPLKVDVGSGPQLGRGALNRLAAVQSDDGGAAPAAHHRSFIHMHKHILAGLAATLAVASLPAAAADNGIYLGGSIGQSSVQDDGIDFDASSTGFKLIAGWRFLDWLALEGNYVDFGSGDDNVAGDQIETDASGVSLSAVGFLPVGPVDLFARAGIIDWSGDVKSQSFGNGSDDGTDLTYGVGAQFRVWGLSLRAEYERFDLDRTDADLFSIGVTWTFL